MTVKIAADKLTKSRHFIWEACKILWRHKKVFFAFAALPMLLDVVDTILSDKRFLELEYYRAVDYYREIGQYLPNTHWPSKGNFESYYLLISKTSYFLKWFIALPLFGIAWFRYLLDPTYRHNLASYFTLDRRFVKFLSCALLILSPYFIGKGYFSFLRGDGDALLILALLVTHYFYIYIPLMGLFIFLSPAILILPLIALGKPYYIIVSLKKSIFRRCHYRVGVLSLISLLVFIPTILGICNNFINQIYTFSIIKYMFFRFLTCALAFSASYVLLGLICSIIVIYGVNKIGKNRI